MTGNVVIRSKVIGKTEAGGPLHQFEVMVNNRDKLLTVEQYDALDAFVALLDPPPPADALQLMGPGNIPIATSKASSPR